VSYWLIAGKAGGSREQYSTYTRVIPPAPPYSPGSPRYATKVVGWGATAVVVIHASLLIGGSLKCARVERTGVAVMVLPQNL